MSTQSLERDRSTRVFAVVGILSPESDQETEGRTLERRLSLSSSTPCEQPRRGTTIGTQGEEPRAQGKGSRAKGAGQRLRAGGDFGFRISHLELRIREE